MKRLFIAYTLLLAMISGCESFIDSITDTASALSEGLVAYYPFNGDSLDVSGNGNHIEPNLLPGDNPTLNSTIPDRFGNFNTCYRFNNQYMVIPINRLSHYFTISLWVNIQAHENEFSGIKLDDVIVSKVSLLNPGLGNADFFLTLKPTSSDIVFKFGYGVDGDAAYSNGGIAPLNNWVHMVIVYDNTISYAYKNGKLSGMSFVDIAQKPDTESEIVLGRLSNPSSLPMNGLIDEVRIYNRALSEAEVLALYNSEKP